MATLKTRCCIVGGGPAGMVMGLLLSRAGVPVIVLEKHADFLRDFRGDTVHPSTLQVLHELGILDEFLRRPHQKVSGVRVQFENESATIADLSHLSTVCRFIAFMPQWEFLDFIAGKARLHTEFALKMQAEAMDLIFAGDRVAGVRASAPEGPIEIYADLVVAADGRQSILRSIAKLPVREFGSPMDVLWFRISRRSGDGEEVFARISRGRIMVMLNRGDYWQCAYLIRKGDFERIRQRGIDSFRNDVAIAAGFLSDRLQEISDWENIRLLTVKVDHLQQWCRPGFLCIGDAAHAMSPIGGVGINIAIQDAVAAANLLISPLRKGSLSLQDLQQVQRRRSLPARATQFIQVAMQNRMIANIIGSEKPARLPFVLRLLDRWPLLRRIPAYLVGIGFRPEHVR